jgi:WhiB family redox-sensing transcriptional regulator
METDNTHTISTNWMDSAACVGMDPEVFFVDTRRVKTKAETRLALDTCARCPVSAECLEYNIDEPFGIWGGKTAEERQKIRKEYGSRRRCQICNKMFETTSVHAKMCSDDCRVYARRMVHARSDAKRYGANIHRSRK